MCKPARGTHFRIGGVGVRWGGVWQEIKGGTPYAAKPRIAAHDPDTRLKSNV